ncbi:ribbon-helix-helix protein, CopG family [Streptomyces sp. B-S-A8]|uniref:Ribbon-helix-helix protein, CopG family n=1 Tax=Streptomyces solicavernae TaxID=3043614 RepID=A0ABT6S2G6_9ACTN|nr:ribbon-helix-helix protein, CopG family [Streptomyces sp. B-S-A8]MDI3390639.1 ribbon-helix-helix protein, CopG family [Streptomyces sp. B-S-A8]
MSKERVTISLDPELAAAIRKLQEAGQIDSVSAYVSEAVEGRLARHERAERVIRNWANDAEEHSPSQWAQALSWARTTAHKDEHTDTQGAA